MRNARVFPDPVFAPARTSQPRSPGKMAHLWISVGSVYLAPSMPSDHTQQLIFKTLNKMHETPIIQILAN